MARRVPYGPLLLLLLRGHLGPVPSWASLLAPGLLRGQDPAVPSEAGARWLLDRSPSPPHRGESSRCPPRPGSDGLGCPLRWPWHLVWSRYGPCPFPSSPWGRGSLFRAWYSVHTPGGHLRGHIGLSVCPSLPGQAGPCTRTPEPTMRGTLHVAPPGAQGAPLEWVQGRPKLRAPQHAAPLGLSPLRPMQLPDQVVPSARRGPPSTAPAHRCRHSQGRGGRGHGGHCASVHPSLSPPARVAHCPGQQG